MVGSISSSLVSTAKYIKSDTVSLLGGRGICNLRHDFLRSKSHGTARKGYIWRCGHACGGMIVLSCLKSISVKLFIEKQFTLRFDPDTMCDLDAVLFAVRDEKA